MAIATRPRDAQGRYAKAGQEIIIGNDERAFKATMAAVAKAFLQTNAGQSAGRLPGSSWSNMGGPNSGLSNQLLARVTQNLAAGFGKAPEELELALAQQGLSWGPPFPPGRPLDPFFGYRRPARTRDFQVGENVQLTPRWNRIAYSTIKSLWEAYDVAQICTKHLINDIRTLDYHFEALPGVQDDVSDDIRKAREFFDSPDKRQPFRTWLAELFMDIIRYDAGCLYIRRNIQGDPVALEVVSGTTIIPVSDYFGRLATDEDDQDPSLTPAGTWHGEITPAYVQIIMGLPWVWLAADDIIYQPINPLPESIYGLAPLEAVLLTANTDIRFQWHFLNLFTAGSIPAGFMEAPPDMSNPVQIVEWQQEWDRLMIGDQEKLHQIRWVPAESKFVPIKPQADEFNSEFPLYLMRRTCAAHGVTPTDLGFTETVNKATSEVQVDVQWRVGTLPYARHAEDLVTSFLINHLKLRVRLRFDTGREVGDRYIMAQTEELYIKNGVLSPDEPRNRMGYPIDVNVVTPRFIDNARSGPIPLEVIRSMAGEIDLQTYAPTKNQKPFDHPYTPLPGVLPVIGSQEHQQAMQASSALQANSIANTDGRPAPYPQDKPLLPLGPPAKRPTTKPPEPKPAAKKPTPKKAAKAKLLKKSELLGYVNKLLDKIEKDAALAGNTGGPGITGDTGIQGVDLLGNDSEANEDKKLKQWRENARNRVRKGNAPKRFPDADPMLSDAIWSNLAVAKSFGDIDASFAPFTKKLHQITVAGIAVVAANSGRCLMLQRDDDDKAPASSRWEWPGGHIDPGETPWDGAMREWQEETGNKLPKGKCVASWAHGEYQGFVYRIEDEKLIWLNPDKDDMQVTDPDHPKQLQTEVMAWWYADDAEKSPGGMRPNFEHFDWKLIRDALKDKE